jgi:glutaconate CoA-transferase subunit B
MAFLGTAQIDRYGNLNTTAVGDYRQPKVRLPGAGGAPEIALSSKEVVVIVRQTVKAFVERVDFVTTPGRKNLKAVITDLGILHRDAQSGELVLAFLHPGVSRKDVQIATGWDLRAVTDLTETAPPTPLELATLREIQSRREIAHRVKDAA